MSLFFVGLRGRDGDRAQLSRRLQGFDGLLGEIDRGKKEFPAPQPESPFTKGT